MAHNNSLFQFRQLTAFTASYVILFIQFLQTYYEPWDRQLSRHKDEENEKMCNFDLKRFDVYQQIWVAVQSERNRGLSKVNNSFSAIKQLLLSNLNCSKLKRMNFGECVQLNSKKCHYRSVFAFQKSTLRWNHRIFVYKRAENQQISLRKLKVNIKLCRIAVPLDELQYKHQIPSKKWHQFWEIEKNRWIDVSQVIWLHGKLPVTNMLTAKCRREEKTHEKWRLIEPIDGSIDFWMRLMFTIDSVNSCECMQYPFEYDSILWSHSL